MGMEGQNCRRTTLLEFNIEKERKSRASALLNIAPFNWLLSGLIEYMEASTNSQSLREVLLNVDLLKLEPVKIDLSSMLSVKSLSRKRQSSKRKFFIVRSMKTLKLRLDCLNTRSLIFAVVVQFI